MTDRPASIQDLRDRLTGLLADWGSELSLVLRELDEKRARVAELEGKQQTHDEQVAGLKKRVDGQDQLIDTLKAEAEEASKLRKEVQGTPPGRQGFDAVASGSPCPSRSGRKGCPGRTS